MKSSRREQISIILPVYNAVNFIEDTIRSVRNQTYQNWELIVINDGSTDESLKVIEKLSFQDSRINYFDIENGGASRARNYGLSKISGEYVAFIDADDKWEPKFLDTLYNYLIEYNADIAMCNIIQNDGNLEFPWKEERCFFGHENIFNEYAIGGICNRIWNKLYRRSVIENIFFDNERQLGEDASWTPRVMNKANRLIRIPEGFYHYIVRKNSLSHYNWIDDVSRMEYITNALIGTSIILKYATDESGREKRLREVIDNCINGITLNLNFNHFNTQQILQELIIENREIYKFCNTKAEREVITMFEKGSSFSTVVKEYRKIVILNGSLLEKRRLILMNLKELVRMLFIKKRSM